MAEPESILRAQKLFQEKKSKFTPSDAIFAAADGAVHEAETPKIFVGATLADRYNIVKYIESGAFGELAARG
jgi:hypothetical protein